MSVEEKEEFGQDRKEERFEKKEEATFSDPSVVEINEGFRNFWALKRSEALLSWDLEVNMPERASESRGFIMGRLALLDQENIKRIYPTLERAHHQTGDLNDYERGVIRIGEYLKKFYTRIPPELLEEEQKVTVEATVVWRNARKKNDFKSFQPFLEKIIDIKLKEAEKLGYQRQPYDALLDLFEEGLTVEDLDSMFSRLIPALKQILEKVLAEKRFPQSHPLEKIHYDIDSMTRVNEKLTEILGLPKDRFRMDTSTHPFTSNTSRDDVRITTRYEGYDFASTMYSTLHESGHGIYELQLNPRLEYTPIGTAASTAFHESQSRFWENIVGRSRAFVSLVSPMLRERLDFLAQYSDEDLYRYINVVRPGMIRVDADELTYNFHIALRYNLEKSLLQGSLKISELPSIWNDTMEEYLGIRPKNETEGVLQDIHWSGGSFGYFPTYSLGNVIAGMIWHNIVKDIDLDVAIRRGDLGPIKLWLYEKIHKYGATYASKDLAQRSLGESFNPDKVISYLKSKYLSS